MKRLSILTILAILFPCALMAAGSAMTMTLSNVGGSHTGMSTLTIAWTSDDATGAVSGTTSDAITAALQGKWAIMGFTDPGTTAPDDNYDIAVTDASGIDIFGGTLEDRDTANSEQALPYIGSAAYGPRPITGALTISVTSAGNSKVGTLTLLISR